jgi:hypothetical protein
MKPVFPPEMERSLTEEQKVAIARETEAKIHLLMMVAKQGSPELSISALVYLVACFISGVAGENQTLRKQVTEQILNTIDRTIDDGLPTNDIAKMQPAGRA